MDTILFWYVMIWWFPGVLSGIYWVHQGMDVTIKDVLGITLVSVFIGPVFTIRWFYDSASIDRALDTIVWKKEPYKED